MNHRRRSGAAIFGLFSALACNAILGNESSFNLVPKSSCLLSSDCPSEQICVFETCSKPCKLDKDCAPGDRCLVASGVDSTACVAPAQATCSGDTCPSGTRCSSGLCRTVCDEADPCRADQRCVEDVCVGTDRNHDPEAASLGGTGGTSGTAGTMSTGGMDNVPEGGDAGGENEGGSGAVSGDNEGGTTHSGGKGGAGTTGKGGAGTAGKGSAGTAGSAGSGGFTGSGGSAGNGGFSASSGSGGSGGFTGSGGSGGSAGSGARSGSGGSGGGCSNGTYQCITTPTTSQKCVNGAWSNDQLCTATTPACFAGKCSECADPAKDCANNVPRSCINGVWQNGSPCSGGKTCAAGACACTLTTCGSICTDTQTDNANCGTCGHSCQNGDCISGKCQPVNIAFNQNKPWSIATDGTTLFWVNQGNRTLIRYTLSSGNSTPFPVSGNCTSASGGLAVFGGKVWWTAFATTCWVATPGTGTPTEIGSMWGGSTTMLNGVAASSNGGYIVDPSDNQLISSTHGTYAYPHSIVHGVAADSAGVYWLDGTNVVLQHDTSALNTGTPGVLSSGFATSEGITTYNSFVYFTGTDTIYRVPNTPGNMQPTALVGGQSNPSGIAVDASGIYWTNRAGGSVMRAPLSGQTATPLASGQNDPHGIALDSTTVYWTNTAGGQVMKIAK